jgi:adenine-specific DNA methylase
MIQYDINLKNFKLNEEGKFSITKPYESYQIVNIMDRYLNTTESIITDATACMGGDLVRFSKYFKKVNGIELCKSNFDLLVENCNIFNCTNVSLYNEDCTQLCKLLKQDVIYFDPQWGGKNYKSKDSIVLKLGQIPLFDFINELRNSVKHIFIKAPINVNLDNVEYDSVHLINNKSKTPSFKLIYISSKSFII